MKRDAMVGDLISLVLAVWLFLSPWIIGFTNLTTAAWVAWIGAIAVGAIAIAALQAAERWKEWVHLALGLALLASPWLVQISGRQKVEDALFQTGLVVATIAILELWVMRNKPAQPRVA